MGKFSSYDKIVITHEKNKRWKSKIFLHEFPPKRLFTNRMHNYLKKTDTTGSAYIICLRRPVSQ